MLPWLREKLFPLQITKRFYMGTIILTITTSLFLVVIMSFLLFNQEQSVSVKETAWAVFLLGLANCFLVILFSRFTFKRINKELRQFAAAVDNNNGRLKEDILPELKPLFNKLRNMQRELHHFFDMSLDLFCIIDLNGNIIHMNRAFENMFRFQDKEFSWQTIGQLLHPDDCQRTVNLNAQVLSEEKVSKFENRCRQPDGSYRWLSWNIVPAIEEGFIYSVAHDITERKKAEEDLRISNAWFKKIFDASPNPIAILNAEDFKFLQVNERFLSLTGYQWEEIKGRTPEEINLLPKEEMYEASQLAFWENAFLIVRNYEINVSGKSGEDLIWLISTELINNGETDCFLVVGADITELKRLESEMARLDRLNLIGQMAAGISHEIRNPMTTVSGFLQMLGGKQKLHEYKEYFNLMQSELNRANSIISEFLSLSRNKKTTFKMNNVNQIIYTLAPLLDSDALLSNSQIKYELGYIPDVLLDEKQIHQLILNLVRNGIESMADGGCITIKTYVEGSNVVLAFSDQGRGIDPEVLKKIGTPFLTTKEKGTGLGLATCYSIAARHNAVIDVETGPGGTTFYIRFKI